MELSKLELEVMQYFWDTDEISAGDVHKRIAAQRKISYSAIKTIVDRLEKKGALARVRTVGRVIIYQPLIKRAQINQTLVHDFIKRVFLGKGKPLLAHILEEEPLSLDDIAELETILNQRKQEML